VAGHQIDELHYDAACGFDHVAIDDLLARIIGALDQHRRGRGDFVLGLAYFAKPNDLRLLLGEQLSRSPLSTSYTAIASRWSFLQELVPPKNTIKMRGRLLRR
jgi:hypothetical protein